MKYLLEIIRDSSSSEESASADTSAYDDTYTSPPQPPPLHLTSSPINTHSKGNSVTGKSLKLSNYEDIKSPKKIHDKAYSSPSLVRSSSDQTQEQPESKFKRHSPQKDNDGDNNNSDIHIPSSILPTLLDDNSGQNEKIENAVGNGLVLSKGDSIVDSGGESTGGKGKIGARDQQEKLLLQKLMVGYEKDVRPVRNHSHPVVVRVGITLTQIFDMVSSQCMQLTFTTFLLLCWGAIIHLM